MAGPGRVGVVCGLVASLLATGRAAAQTPLGSAFTYQGRLTDAGTPANGAHDFQFTLWSAATGGTQIGLTVARDDVAVVNGLFIVTLDFTNVFGTKRFLETSVRPGASTGAFTLLAGRQELTPTPAALYSTVTAAAPWAGLTGVPAGFADGADNDSGGDITGLLAGAGLTGGGTAGDINLSVAFGGTGGGLQAARSDHHHFGVAWTGSSASTGLSVTNSNGAGIGGVGTSYGLVGTGSNGTGVRGTGMTGVEGASATNPATGVTGQALGGGVNTGVFGSASGAQGRGVFGTGASGVVGQGQNVGVSGSTSGTTGTDAGVYGVTTIAFTSGATGVWGVAAGTSSYAGYFSGRAHVNGAFSKSAGSFKIDHPLDPENKYLYHSFVESPDMMNVYNGNVVLDASGQADVALPDWFEALNQEFRYQLTAIGGPGPGLHVAREIAGNRFRIGGGSPGLKVSWQVTGIRHDAYAEKNRVPVEEMKPEHERGVYLQPEAHGLPAERGLDHRRAPRPIAP